MRSTTADELASCAEDDDSLAALDEAELELELAALEEFAASFADEAAELDAEEEADEDASLLELAAADDVAADEALACAAFDDEAETEAEADDADWEATASCEEAASSWTDDAAGALAGPVHEANGPVASAMPAMASAAARGTITAQGLTPLLA